MDIANFFPNQKEIDSKIIIDKSLTEYKVLARKNLQLQIKLGQLADETKCYKYWIGEDTICDSNSIFEKYILCFRQILSIGLDKNYSDVTNIVVTPSEFCLSDQFINLYIDINDLMISPSKDHFVTILEDFLSLGVSLGFTESQITEGFHTIGNKI